MRGPLRPVAPSLGDSAGRSRNGPDSKGPELPPSQETGEVRSRTIPFDRTGQPSTPAREGAEDQMNMTLLRTAFLLFAVSVLSFSLQAQSNSTDAHLSGRVTDASGYTIAGVKITAQPENAAVPTASTSTARRCLHCSFGFWPLPDSFRTYLFRPSRIFSFAVRFRLSHSRRQARTRASLKRTAKEKIREGRKR